MTLVHLVLLALMFVAGVIFGHALFGSRRVLIVHRDGRVEVQVVTGDVVVREAAGAEAWFESVGR